MGDSLPLRDLLPPRTLLGQRGRTLVSSWIFLPHATYLGHRPPTDRLDRRFPFPRVFGLLDFLVHDAKPSLLLHELFWSPIITLGTTMLSNLQPLTDGCKASWAGLVSSVGIDFSKVHPTLPTNPFSQRASGTDTFDSIVTTTYHWVPRTLDNTCTCLTTKPSSMGRCKLMGTEPIFGNKTLKPLMGLSLN